MVEVIKGKPFTLPDGTTITPNGNEPGKANVINMDNDEVVEDSSPDLDEEIDDPFIDGLTFKRNLADLPDSPKRVNPIMLVLAYNMWGLDSTSIGMLLDLPTEQVDNVLRDDLLIEMRKDILQAIRYAEIGTIHGYLSQKSLLAAKVVVKHMKGKDNDRSLTAAKDILDRSGFRPSDRVEHVHKFEDELRIVYVKEQATPIIDLSFKELTHGDGS